MFLSERCCILVYVPRETSYGSGVESVYTFVYIWGWIGMLKNLVGKSGREFEDSIKFFMIFQDFSYMEFLCIITSLYLCYIYVIYSNMSYDIVFTIFCV